GFATTLSTVPVSGTVSPSTATACVNNEPAPIPDGQFSGINALLAIGSNTLVVGASLPDGNLILNSTTVVNRTIANQPPAISISLSSLDACDLTPDLAVSFSDPDSSGSLDLSTFRAILNGTDVTSSYLGSATFASPLPAGSTSAVWRMAASQALTPGDNV